MNKHRESQPGFIIMQRMRNLGTLSPATGWLYQKPPAEACRMLWKRKQSLRVRQDKGHQVIKVLYWSKHMGTRRNWSRVHRVCKGLQPVLCMWVIVYFLLDSWVSKQVTLHFLYLLLRSFPSVFLFCPVQMYSFLYYHTLILKSPLFCDERQKEWI